MAKAPAASLEPKSRDWVSLFITYSSARSTQQLPDTDSACVPQPSPSSVSESDADSVSASELSQLDAAAGGEEPIEKEQMSPHGVYVGAKAWRVQLKEWLGFVGGLRGARGMFRSGDLKQCVVRHLLDTDSGVQQAALKALQVLPTAPKHSWRFAVPVLQCIYSCVNVMGI